MSAKCGGAGLRKVGAIEVLRVVCESSPKSKMPSVQRGHGLSPKGQVNALSYFRVMEDHSSA